MARLFEQQEKREVRSGNVKSIAPGLLLNLVFVIVFSIMIMFVIREKKEKYKNKNNMELVTLLKMDNGNILTKKVKYQTAEKVNPEDTSDLFFEVVNPGASDLENGDLIKFNHRFVQEVQIEGKIYCIIDASQIQYHLNQKDVKEDLLKR